MNNFDLTYILSEVNTLLPQLSNFVTQFNNLVLETSINVITDSSGNMSIDVPNNMTDAEADKISKRISIIDRLITNHSNKIQTLLDKGLNLEAETKIKDNNYTNSSDLIDKVKELNRLNAIYKH